jgi:hypothetical protein
MVSRVIFGAGNGARNRWEKLMARFNADTYPDREAFDAYVRALRRQEFVRMAAAARTRLAQALRRFRGFVARGVGSAADVPLAASPRRRAH